MITIMETKKIANNKQLVDIACLSTDTKPTTGIMNGSMLIETDTGKVCIYNEADGEWTEIGSGGGGSGTSDFSTAEVVFSNTTGSTVMQSGSVVLEFMGEQGMALEFPILVNDPITVDVILFKGSQTIYAPEDVNITVTGDITEEEGEIVITGDGTISYTTK